MAAEKYDDQESLAAEDSGAPKAELSSGDSSALGVSVHKVCCRCGTELSGKTRFKDSQGKYWCPACNEKDQLRQQPAVCPDCKGEFTRADLQEFKGTAVCAECWEKRKQSAKREEARLRAVQEAEAEIVAQKRRWRMIVSWLIAIVMLWALLMAWFWIDKRMHARVQTTSRDDCRQSLA